MWDKVKSAAKWAWNWITVLAVTVLGTLSIALDYLSEFAGVDFTQLMTERRAAQISLGVAFIKASVAAYNSHKGSV